MDQGVIATFMDMVKVLNRPEKIIEDYWCTFNILKGINTTDTAWEEVSVNYLNGKWCKLLPKIMHDFTRFEPVENTAEDVGWLAQEVGLMRLQPKINSAVV